MADCQYPFSPLTFSVDVNRQTIVLWGQSASELDNRLLSRSESPKRYLKGTAMWTNHRVRFTYVLPWCLCRMHKNTWIWVQDRKSGSLFRPIIDKISISSTVGQWVLLIKVDRRTLGTFPKLNSSKTDQQYYFRKRKVETPRVYPTRLSAERRGSSSSSSNRQYCGVKIFVRV